MQSWNSSFTLSLPHIDCVRIKRPIVTGADAQYKGWQRSEGKHHLSQVMKAAIFRFDMAWYKDHNLKASISDKEMRLWKYSVWTDWSSIVVVVIELSSERGQKLSHSSCALILSLSVLFYCSETISYFNKRMDAIENIARDSRLS